jgi:hypothetical protein
MVALVFLLSRPTARHEIFTPLELSGGYSFVRDPKQHQLADRMDGGQRRRRANGGSAIADVSGNNKFPHSGPTLRISVHTAMGGVGGSFASAGDGVRSGSRGRRARQRHSVQFPRTPQMRSASSRVRGLSLESAAGRPRQFDVRSSRVSRTATIPVTNIASSPGSSTVSRR